MSKIRICYYLERWSSGGIESFITNMLTGIPLGELQFDIVADVVDGDSIFTPAVTSVGVRIVQLSGKLRARKNAKEFRRLLEQNHYDIVHLHIFHGLALKYAKIAKECGVPVRIAHSHGAGFGYGRPHSPMLAVKNFVHLISCKQLMKYVTHGFACSRAAAEFMHLSSPSIIRNGIDTERFSFSQADRERIREEFGITQEADAVYGAKEACVIGHIGRFSPEKNHLFILDIFNEVLLHSPLPSRFNMKLMLVGDGDMRPAIEKRIAELGLWDSVILTGARKDAPALLSAMDLLIFPSKAEGFGMVSLEAQASGLPVLTTPTVAEQTGVEGANVHSMLLTAPVGMWSDIVATTLLDSKAQRDSGVELVKKAGYDRAQVASELFDLYRAIAK